MQHRLLLGSTALVSAGLLMSGGAEAQEMRAGGIEVVLGGYTEFGVKAANEDTLRDNNNSRNYLFFMDNEVFINANGATDTGILYGSKIELEVGSGDGNVDDAFVDEVGLFFSGNFGRFELGRDDGANDVMGINGADAQAGTGGIDGDTANLAQFESIDTGDDAKITYFTPRVAGFQLGASFQPGDGDGFTENDGGQENIFSGGINWVGALGPVDLIVAATGIMGNSEPGNGGDDLESWDAGALVGFGGFSIGGGVGQNTDLDEADFANAGLKFGFGAANVSVGYVYFDPDGGSTQHLWSASGDIGLMPGVTLKGDVTYNTDDPNGDCNEVLGVNVCDNEETIAGVLTIQLDY